MVRKERLERTIRASIVGDADDEKAMEAMDQIQKKVEQLLVKYKSLFKCHVWSSINRVYATRIDCRTGRLEAA